MNSWCRSSVLPNKLLLSARFTRGTLEIIGVRVKLFPSCLPQAGPGGYAHPSVAVRETAHIAR